MRQVGLELTKLAANVAKITILAVSLVNVAILAASMANASLANASLANASTANASMANEENPSNFQVSTRTLSENSWWKTPSVVLSFPDKGSCLKRTKYERICIGYGIGIVANEDVRAIDCSFRRAANLLVREVCKDTHATAIQGTLVGNDLLASAIDEVNISRADNGMSLSESNKLLIEGEYRVGIINFCGSIDDGVVVGNANPRRTGSETCGF